MWTSRRGSALLLPVLLALIGTEVGGVRRAGAKPTPCTGGFIVQGGPLLPGAPPSQVDVLRLQGPPFTLDLGIGCEATALVGGVKVHATKKRTAVRAVWKNCAGLTGRIKFGASISESCGKLHGSLRSKAIKRTFDALASRCGDGFVDTDGGESCDLGATCPDASACPTGCSCTTTTLPSSCNPLTAPGSQGCPANQKCTWITLQTSPDAIGTVGCMPAGNIAEGIACTQGAPGPTTGYDDCQTGLICIGGVCADLCGFDGGANSACAIGSSCIKYSGLFANGIDDPTAGACQLSCDPLTQLRSDSTPCPGAQGCYISSTSLATTTVCAQAGTIDHGQPITGAAFVNSCLPGLKPRRVSTGSSNFECGALCKPADVYQGNNTADEGGVAPYTCQGHGAAAPSDVANGESCRYWWATESFTPPSAYGNTLGFCLKHSAVLYDSDGDQNPDAPFPRCVDLTTGDVLFPVSNPPQSDAEYFFCTALAAGTAAPARLSAPGLIGNWR